MNIKDNIVLEMLNRLIISERFNKSQTIHMVGLALISKNINELKENLDWEDIYSKS